MKYNTKNGKMKDDKTTKWKNWGENEKMEEMKKGENENRKNEKM